MDIPLPEESQPPGLPDGQVSSEFPQCDNIPLPSCGMQFNTTAIPPPIPPTALPIAAPVLPPEAPPLQQTSETNTEQADDPNRYSPSRATTEDDIPATPPPPPLLPPPKSEPSRSHSFGPKTTVLGKAQAKKRLLAFSMTKQGGGAGLSFGFQKKVVPKVNTGSAKVFAGAAVDDDGVQESKDTAVKQEKQVPQGGKKKSCKKGLSRDDKARAVVSAIEEIKREELMLRGAIAYGSLEVKTTGDMTAPLPLLGQPLGISLKPKDEFDLSGNPLLEQQKGAIESLLDSLLSQSDKAQSNDKGAMNSEMEADAGRSERHDGGRRKEDRKKETGGTSSRHRSDGRERRRSKGRHSHSGKDRHKDEKRSRAPPTELPISWAHFHSGGYRVEEIRRLKLKLEDRDLGGSSSGSRSRDRHRRRSRDRRSRSREDRKHRKSPTHDGDKERKTEEDLDHLYRPFEGPPQLRFPMVITNSTQTVIEYPRGLVRYTKIRPAVSYCENPDSTSAHFRSRTEIFADATSEIVTVMKEIMNSKQLEEPIRIKQEPGENLSSSLAALQVSYDEAEVGGSPSSPENVADGRRKERSWFTEKDYLISTEHEGKDENSMTEAEIIKNEEDLEMDRENITERKVSMESMDVVENDHHTLSSNEQDKEKTPQTQSPDAAKAERTTVRSKWDSDYEEDMMSAEDAQADTIEKGSFDHGVEVNSKLVNQDYVVEERQNRNTGEYDKDLDTQGEERLLNDEERPSIREESLRKEEQQNKTHLEEKSKVAKETIVKDDDDDDDDDDEEEEEEEEEDDDDVDMQADDFPLRTEEVSKANLVSVETSNEGNTDQKLVSEYEEFMKAVSFDTVLADEQGGSGDEACQQQESAESDKEPLEGDIFERRQMEINVNDTWDEDSKERMEDREERVNTDLMILEKVIREGRESNAKKKKKKQDFRPRSSSSSSDEEDNLKSKKHDKKRKNNRDNEKRKKENRRKSYTSDGSTSSDDSSSSSSEEDDHEKRKHVTKKEKGRKKLEEESDDQIKEIAEKTKSKYKKIAKKKKRGSRKKKKQRKRSKRRKVETSSSSDSSSDSDEESSSSGSERGRKCHKNKESKGHRKDEDSSSEDSSSSSSSESSSSSSSSHGKSSKKRRRRKNSKKTKKETRKRRKERSRKKKKHRRDSTNSEMENSNKSKISKSNRKGEGSRRLSDSRNLDNGDDAINLEELEAQIVEVRHPDDGDISAIHFENASSTDTDQQKNSRQMSLKEDRKALTLESSDSNNSKDHKEQRQSKNEESRRETEDRNMFMGNDVNSSGESCWEEGHKHKRKRDTVAEDSHERAMNNVTAEVEDDGGREVERRKILKKRRRDRRSHSASPLNNLGRKRRRSPSTSPDHSPTPQRRSSTEGKDKGRRGSTASRSQTHSGYHLKHGDGDGRKRGHSQDDMELDPTDFAEHPGIGDHTFMEEVDQSGFESCTGDTFEGLKSKQTEVATDGGVRRDKRHNYRNSQDFSSSGEDNDIRRKKCTEDLGSQNENKIHRRPSLRESDSVKVDRNFRKESDSCEKDRSSPLLRELKQEIVSGDEEFTNEHMSGENRGGVKDNNSEPNHNNSNIWEVKSDDGSGHFSFTRSNSKKELRNSSHRAPDFEESDSVYSPGDTFESRQDSESVKKNISDSIDSSSQNSNVVSKTVDSYLCDMSLDSLSSPPVSGMESTAVLHNQDSCGTSPSTMGNLKVIDQWSGYDSPSQGSSSKGDTSQLDSFMSLENIPLPPPASQIEENKNKIQHDFDHNKTSCEILPPLPSTVPPISSSTSNSSLSEDVVAQIATSDSDPKPSASQPLESPVSQRKLLGKPPMQKHVITVKLLSPLARLQSASESKSLGKASPFETGIQYQTKASNEVTECSHLSVEKKKEQDGKPGIESLCPDESSASNEMYKSGETESKVRIKHPWKSFGFSLKGEGSNITLYDDILETNVTEEQVSSTTVKSIPDIDKQEKSHSGEAVAKERVRKRPSRWGMMTTPAKPVAEDMQQDAAITSQQKCDTNQNHCEAVPAGCSSSEVKDGEVGNKDLYKYKQQGDGPAEPKPDNSSSQEDRSRRRKSSGESIMVLGSSQCETRRRDSRDSESRRVSADKHSMEEERRDRRKDRDRVKDKPEDRDLSRRARGEDRETESRWREDRDRDKIWEERSSDREKRDNKRGETANNIEIQEQDCEQRKEYRDYDENNAKPSDGNGFSDSCLPSDYKTDWQDGGESSHDDRPITRSDSGWGDSGDYSIPRLNSSVDPPWESRVVRYRSRSRSASPEFRGWEDTPARRAREDEQGRGRLDDRRNSSRERYEDQPRLSLERQDLARHDSAEDERIRETSTECDRIRNSTRDHERLRESSRERMRESSRDRMRESSRDRDRMRESSRDRDRMRESSRDRDRMRDSSRDHDRLRESSRDQERMRVSSRDQDRLREGSRERDRLQDNSRDRDRLRENSRDQERLRESGSRDRDRVRGGSRDRDRLRESSRDHERIRERQEDRERRDDRCIRDRWSDDLDRGRDRERDRRGDRRRRERKKDDRSRDRDRDRGRWAERRSRSPMVEDRREHESSGSGHYIPDIPLPMASGGDSWGPSTGVVSGEADMELSCSPASSPLVGFKRSLADSTISDSELVAAAGKQDEHHPSSPFQQRSGYYNRDCYPPAPYATQVECNASPTISPSFSPKRISLDDRIELELGVKKSPPPLPSAPQQIPVYHQHRSYPAPYPGYQGGNYYPIPPPQPHYQGNEKVMPGHPHYMHPHEEFSGAPQHEGLHQHHKQFIGGPPPMPPEEKYGPTPAKRRPPLLPTPTNIAPDVSRWDSAEAFIGAQDAHRMVVTPESFAQHGQPVVVTSETFMGSQHLGGNSHVVQVGNVLQVVPTDLPPGSVLGALPPPPPPAQQPQAHKTMVLQAGNVLQVIPSENLPVPNGSGSGGTQVFQVGNMLQVVPGASPCPTPPAVKPPQHVVMKQAKTSAASPSPAMPQPGIQAPGTAEMSMGHSPVASSPIAKVPQSPRHKLPVVSGPPLPLSTTPVNQSMAVATMSGMFPGIPPLPVPASGYSPPASPFLITDPQLPLFPAEVAPVVTEVPIPFLSPSESPREEAERRREDRERRRQEKEKRRREKEKRRQIKLKHAADNFIKKALQQEGDQTDIDLEEMRLIEEAMRQVPDCEDEPAMEVLPVTPSKKKRRPPAQFKPLPPAGKGILISPGFRERPILGENEERKSVKFADGVRPGEGTSPSAGEDLPSPPPPPRKLPKEKRFKKKKKKKIKVKIIRQINVEDDDDEEDVSPPPPPPGSPPPPPIYSPGYPTGYPPSGYVYSQPTSYTVLPGSEGGAPAPGAPTGSATVFTPMYHQHQHTTTTTHTTTVQFAPPPPPPLTPAPPPPPNPHVYPPTGKQRKTK